MIDNIHTKKQNMHFCHGFYSKFNDVMTFDECDEHAWTSLEYCMTQNANMGIYEFLRDESTQPYVKPYFDVDIITDTKTDPEQIKHKVLEIQNQLAPFFHKHPILVAGSVRKKNEKWKLSFHVIHVLTILQQSLEHI